MTQTYLLARLPRAKKQRVASLDDAIVWVPTVVLVVLFIAIPMLSLVGCSFDPCAVDWPRHCYLGP